MMFVIFLLRFTFAVMYVSQTSTVSADMLNTFNFERLIVQFNEIVYQSVPEMISLISVIATRFSKIYIELELENILSGELPNVYNSTLAVAKYNCRPTTKNKLQVILGLHRHYYPSCKCFDIVRKPIEAYADQANFECSDTITTILLFPNDFCESSGLKCNSTDIKERRYKWGVSTTFNEYCIQNSTINSIRRDFKPDLILLDYEESEENLQKDLTKCTSFARLPDYQPKSFIKKLIKSDIGKGNIISMLDLVTTWKRVQKEPGFLYVIAEAFDTEWATSGWWYKNNTLNSSTLVFEEKLSIANEIDEFENPKNFDWLREEILFNRNKTGIICKQYSCLDYIGKSDFCRVISFDSWEAGEIVQKLDKNSNCSGYSQVFLSQKLKAIHNITETLLNCERNNVTLLLDLSTDFPLRNVSKNYNTRMKYYSTFIDDLTKSGHKFACMFSMYTCGEYNFETNDQSKNFFLNLLNAHNSISFLFAYEEDEYNVKYGATRMFYKRIENLNKCRDIVLKNDKPNARIGYAMIGYYKYDEFQKYPWAIQNYVRYIKLMKNWVEQQQNTVIYLGHFRDGEDIVFRDQKPVVGWYTYDRSNNVYTNKRQDALELSMLHFSGPNNNFTLTVTESALSTIQIVITALIVPILIAVIIMSTIYFVRKYYAEKRLTNDEIEIFLKGEDKNEFEANKVPYDKDRYEISKRNFIVDEDDPLGSGEFGKVSRGQISVNGETVNVAVKTTNPNKSHKTMLKGLLSEIKVLAYVGKHENIIELLGANTEFLKDGRVYIFLELCELGSMEKILREMRPSERNVDNEKINFGEDIVAPAYIAISELTNKLLDISHYGDVYRWSTEICTGMAYLAEKNVVHADLATRNVLLNFKREAKICDFGLSRRMYNYTNYVKTGQEPLPWKWMAPEALRFNTFNEKTDVWSYGVTLWEIYSLGSIPFAGLSWDLNFPQMLERGLRLCEPEYVEREMYSVMQQCWQIDQDKRLTFSQILAIFSTKNDKFSTLNK